MKCIKNLHTVAFLCRSLPYSPGRHRISFGEMFRIRVNNLSRWKRRKKRNIFQIITSYILLLSFLARSRFWIWIYKSYTIFLVLHQRAELIFQTLFQEIVYYVQHGITSIWIMNFRFDEWSTIWRLIDLEELLYSSS